MRRGRPSPRPRAVRPRPEVRSSTSPDRAISRRCSRRSADHPQLDGRHAGVQNDRFVHRSFVHVPDATGAFRSAHYISDSRAGPGRRVRPVLRRPGRARLPARRARRGRHRESEDLRRYLRSPQGTIRRTSASFQGPFCPSFSSCPNVSNGESAISADAARQVFGNGGHVAPWLNPALFFIRGTGTATTRLIGLAIDVPVPGQKFWGPIKAPRKARGQPERRPRSIRGTRSDRISARISTTRTSSV